ncbi:hypothetical protein KC207_08775 [Phycicoccus sp. BSK3Z-2]|uniref:Uncharacterized protein n=1 Tax=Phycicoccus avicenniae TaxID=2828860 RepID=A0A941D8D0_9MICO|nr:hypothetical protein [Phycicoccus avicenniae]MBR7743381.1 hypothetical protein [Phycicoccus avicenniae]
MILLGIVLVLVALGLGALLVVGAVRLEDPVVIDVLGGSVNLPPIVFLVAGMVLISLFWLGWAVLRTGARRSRRRRHDTKEAERRAKEQRAAEEQRMKDEVAARDRQLEAERRAHEEETQRLRREADERNAGRQSGPGTESRRAEVTDGRGTGDGSTTTAPTTSDDSSRTSGGGTVPPPPPPRG